MDWGQSGSDPSLTPGTEADAKAAVPTLAPFWLPGALPGSRVPSREWQQRGDSKRGRVWQDRGHTPTPAPNCSTHLAAPPRTKSGRWESPSEGGEREHSHGNADGDGEWSHSSSPSGCPLPGLGGFPAAPGYKSPLSERGTGAAPARTRCPRATARPFRRDPEGSRRDLHRHTLGTRYSTIPCCRGMGKAGAMALSPCSATAFPWDRTLGTGQVANRMGHKARCQRGVGLYCETRRGQK